MRELGGPDRKRSAVAGGLQQVWGQLWRDFGVGVFHEFFAYKFGGNELMQGRTLTPSTGQRNTEGL